MRITKRQLNNLIKRNLNEATAEEISHLDEALKIPKKFLPFQNMFGDKYRKVIPLYPNTPDSNNFNGLSGILLLTRHPIDVYRMSDFESIGSCHSPPSKKRRADAFYDSLNECILAEAYAFGIVAYFYEIGDKEKIDEIIAAINIDDDKEIFADTDRGIVTGLPDPNARARIKNVTYHSKSNNKTLYKKFKTFDTEKHKDEYKFEGEESESPITFLPVLETKRIYGSIKANDIKVINNYIQSILKPYQTQAMSEIIDNVTKDNVDNKTIDFTNFYKIGGTYQDSPVDEEIKNIITTYNKDNNSSFVTNGSVNLTSEFQDDVITQMTKQQTMTDAKNELPKFKNYIETLPTKTEKLDSDGIFKDGKMNFEISEPSANEFYLVLPNNPTPFLANLKFGPSNKFFINFESDPFHSKKQVARRLPSRLSYDLTYINNFGSNLNKKIQSNDQFRSSIANLFPNNDISLFRPIREVLFVIDDKILLRYDDQNLKDDPNTQSGNIDSNGVDSPALNESNSLDSSDYGGGDIDSDGLNSNDPNLLPYDENRPAELISQGTDNFNIQLFLDFNNITNLTNGKISDWIIVFKRVFESLTKIKEDIKDYIIQELVELDVIKVNEYQYHEDFEAKQRKEKEKFEKQEAWKASQNQDYKKRVFKGKEYNDAELREKIKNLDIYKKYSFVYKELIGSINTFFPEGKLKDIVDVDCKIDVVSDKQINVVGDVIKFKNIKGFKIKYKINFDNSIVNLLDYYKNKDSKVTKLLDFDKDLCNVENLPTDITFPSELCNYCRHISKVNIQNHQLDNEITFDLENFLKQINIDEYIYEFNRFNYEYMKKISFTNLFVKITDYILTYLNYLKRTSRILVPSPFQANNNINNPYYTQPQQPKLPEEPPPFPDDELVPLDENRINELIMRRVITNLVYKRIKNKFV